MSGATALHSIRRSDNLRPALLAFAVLAVSVFYTVSVVFLVPYPGIEYDTQWRVTAVDDPCRQRPDWCAAYGAKLQIGDTLTVVGDLTREEYDRSLTRVPFAGYATGDEIPVTFLREGVEQRIDWQMLGPYGTRPYLRLLLQLAFVPFWLAGTVVALFLRPRDERWTLLIAYNFLLGLWWVTGVNSASQIGGSVLIMHAISWILMPVSLHLHALLPTSIDRARWRNVFPPIYAVGFLLAILELLRIAPGSLFAVALIAAVIGSVALLVYRVMNRAAPATQMVARTILIGVVVSVGPAMVLWVITHFSGSSEVATATGTYLPMLTVAMLPFFYIYALYRSRLGDLEFRANRLLSLYSFILVYFCAFAFVFGIGSQWIKFPTDALIFAMITSTLFVALALPFRDPYQRLIDRLIYGTEHNPDDIIQHFANKIPRALNQEALVKLLTGEVAPSLLIRQSALYLVSDIAYKLYYADGVTPSRAPDFVQTLDRLVAHAGRYLPPDPGTQGPWDWVRLVIPIDVGENRIAVWLFGARDPDDFYPKPDCDLLTTLGNQVGVALETARLIESLQYRASELELAYRELQEMDQLKDRFVQNVSHELRTPLTFVLGYGELLLDGIPGALEPAQRQAIETIVDRTKGIVRLVNEIISSNQSEVRRTERQPVNVDALARSCLQAAEIADQRRQTGRHRFVLDITSGLPAILSDRGRLNQILDNLVGNAAKFSPDGGTITLRIHAVRHEFPAGSHGGEPQPALDISVSDEGIGIPDDKLPRIWERFYQVDGSTTRRFEGLGLGLAIVRSIVEAYGGVVSAESKENVGTTVRIVLPLGEGHVPAEVLIGPAGSEASLVERV